MANLIILEGLSRTGKTTICNKLSEKNGYLNISVKDKMPGYVQNLPDFYHGMHVITNQFFKAFKDETFIIDRSFLSEMVYSRFFDRPSYVTQGDVINDLLFDNNFILVYFSNRYQSYIERSPKDKIIYTETEFNKQKDLFEWYFDTNKKHFDNQDWQDRFLRISSVENSVDSCIEQIETKIKQTFNEKIIA
jgi:thymidylate kinase